MPVTYEEIAKDAMIADMRSALVEIAHGRPDNGRPLAAEASRQVARGVLVKHRISWSRPDAKKRT